MSQEVVHRHRQQGVHLDGLPAHTAEVSVEDIDAVEFLVDKSTLQVIGEVADFDR